MRRLPARAAYDAATVYGILDAAHVGHVGFVRQGRPVVIPMLYGRRGDVLYLHGSIASQLQRALAGGTDMCLTATVVDGLVFARSAFHHSMNYRSVVVMATASPVEGEEKLAGLRAIVEHLAPGRFEEVRPPNEHEMRLTSVLRLPIDEASAKIRVGGPVDDVEDLALPIWAGEVPIVQRFEAPHDADDLRGGIAPTPAVTALARGLPREP